MTGKIQGKFKFDCHPGLSCFGQCCRDINIFLTPYDVLRMRKQLNLSSAEFLDQYTIKFTAPTGFPLVFIKMREEDNLNCPFVSPRGCLVYQERPWACRMAPVDIQGEGQYGFIFDSNKCHGLKESREWTVGEWMSNQGVEVYEEVEKVFKEIPLELRKTARLLMDEDMGELFFKVCYDLDKFKEMIQAKDWQERHGVVPEVVARLNSNDLALLQFGFQWLREEIKVLKRARRSTE